MIRTDHKTGQTIVKALALGVSVVALAGCSWLPGKSKSHSYGHHAGSYKAQPAYGAKGYGQQAYGQSGFGHCQVPHAQAPVPAGCHPASVTIGTGAQGFAQQPQFGAGYGSVSQATGAYGSHALAAHGVHAAAAGPKLRKPRWRGQLELGAEKSQSGNLLDYANFPGIDPVALYDPSLYFEGFTQGSAAEGRIVDTIYSSVTEEVRQPRISWDDVYSTPVGLRGGVEYIASPNTTLFAKGGYTTAEGNSGPAVTIQSELRRSEIVTEFLDQNIIDPDTGEVIGTETIALAPRTNTQFIPNIENTATFEFDFNDLRRIDLEAGARHYFQPFKHAGLAKVSPFVGASAGASHFNGTSFTVSQRQAFLRRSFEDQSTEGNMYEVIPNVYGPDGLTVQVSDSQWVPRGAVNAGLEWQATPRTAVAFETGIAVEGGRKYTNGVREDENISIPFTIRGSYNF